MNRKDSLIKKVDFKSFENNILKINIEANAKVKELLNLHLCETELIVETSLIDDNGSINFCDSDFGEIEFGVNIYLKNPEIYSKKPKFGCHINYKSTSVCGQFDFADCASKDSITPKYIFMTLVNKYLMDYEKFYK